MDILKEFAKGFAQGFIIQSLWLQIQKKQRTDNPGKRYTDNNNTECEVMKIDK